MNKFITLFSIRRLLECRMVTSKSRISATGKDVPLRKQTENRITLIGTDDSVSITDLKNAQSLSVRRELKLVKIQDVDAKTRRPVYKLMSNAEYHSEELQKRKEKQISRQNSALKGDKLLTLSSRIGDNDLMTGINKMIKLLEKQYEIRVVIVGEGEQATEKPENIYSVIEKNVKSFGKVVQKRFKGNSLRFQLLPLKNASTQDEQDGNTASNQNSNDKGPL